MMSFEIGDIVLVDYPHVETKVLKRRPALVVSNTVLGPDGLVFWALMITSAANRRWPGDLLVKDHVAVGLPIPSVIRTEKIATVELGGAERINCIDAAQLDEVRKRMSNYLGLRFD